MLVRQNKWHGLGKVVAGALLLLPLLCLGCEAKLDKVPEAEVDAEQKALAQRIGTKISAACVNGEFEPLGDEATKPMQEGLTPEKQKKACESIKSQIGDFQSMEYFDTYRPKEAPDARIYRFKSTYSKSEDPWETRVVFDGAGKLSGLWTKPWRDVPR